MKDAIDTEENKVPQASILEQVSDHENLKTAYDRVRSNKGSPGIDGMTVEDFLDWGRKYLPAIMDRIRTGFYKPAPVRRVWIPKPNGEKRPLGIPTVLDRVIQQAISQIMNPIFDVDFSDRSYGFRYGKRAIDAVGQVSKYTQKGYKWAVDCDLKSFFDIVNHDILMKRIGRKVRDKKLLKLIGKYLRAGVRHKDGSTEKTTRGVPQGGPLSPLLANIMLDPLDKEIENMGLPFVRYADDFLILCRTKAQAIQAKAEVSAFITGTLKLIINDEKTRIAPVKECAFLGFQVHGKRIKRSDKSAIRFKSKIKEILSRSRGISMSKRLKELREYVTGWFHYFKKGLLFGECQLWDQWMRRRVRLCYWKQWKRLRRRRQMLLRLGIDRSEVKLASRSRKGYWRMSANSLVQVALNDEWLKENGVPYIKDLWIAYKYPSQAKA